VSSSGFLSTPLRQASVVDDAGHRPWPIPESPWVYAQTWEELAFLHWRVDADAVRALLPHGLELDMHDGAAWLGVTPFRVTGFRLRGVPPLPLLSTFPQLTVRTYVTRDGKPGIWFFSLDVGSQLAAEAAKRLYRLPYRHARMSVDRRGGFVHYDSSRPGTVFSARFRGSGDILHAQPGSTEEFLTERYCVYAADDERLYRAELHHPPWSLQAGEAAVELNTMAPAGVVLPHDQPLVRFAARQDVVMWGLEAV
jgi:uncharacterized protein YqjF (DUF2071 family)